jgi:hypothetical protein
LFCLFSSKGGVGCSVSAAALALLSADHRSTLLVDLRGDLDLILGLPPSAEGLSDWFAVDQPSPDLLHRLEVPVTERLSLLPRGGCRSPARPDRYRLLAQLLRADPRRVVVDIGTHAVPAVAVLSEASASLLVTRACFLALDTAQRGPSPDQVVLVAEEGRALRRRDVEAAIGAPVVVSLRWHASVSRAVDAGLLSARMPRPLRDLAGLL